MGTEREDILTKVKERFKDKILESIEATPVRNYLDLKPEDIPEAARYLFDELKLRFAIASGVNRRDGIEILYHFSHDKTGLMISLRTVLDRDNPEIESLAPAIKATEWIEREIHELLGVNFKNHPNLKRLVLADDWPEGNYPLRHDQEKK